MHYFTIFIFTLIYIKNIIQNRLGDFMNKLILIDLIKTYIELYIDGKLSLETITQTFYNNQSKEIDQNKIV